MAIFHLSVKTFSRGHGDAIMAAAAYISREKLFDHYYGVYHSFTGRDDLLYSRIFLPPNAPEEYSDRTTLWNAVEKSEHRVNSRLARGIKMALPGELMPEEQVHITEHYVLSNFVDRGMIADVAIHDKGDGNPHAHVLLTTRDVNEKGFGSKNRDWDKRARLNEWRKEWANEQNHELLRRGFEPVSHECYAVQDLGRVIERVPNIHLGHQVIELDRAGVETDRMKKHREIAEHNRSIEIQLERKRERQHSRGRGR